MHGIKKQIPLFLLGLLIAFTFQSKAAHILGGQVTYEHMGGTQYKVIQTLFIECNGSTAQNGQITAWPNDGSSEIAKASSPKVFSGFVDNTYIYNPCLQPPPSVCVRKEIYETTFNLANGKDGWILATHYGNRGAGLVNIDAPSQYSSIFWCSVPDPNDPNVGTPNNSPVFQDPPPNLCLNDFITYNHSGADADGDSITYSLCTPYGIISPSGLINPPIPPPPYANIPWAAGYSAAYPIDANPPFTINPTTGVLTGEPNSNGQYVWSICYREHRNGNFIAEGSRDYVFRVINCGPRTPTLVPVAQAGMADSSGYCAPDRSVAFKNNSTNAVTYFWDFGDPNRTDDTSNVKEPTWVYDEDGTYNVWLYLNRGYACSDSVELTFEIFTEVDATFTPPAPQCLTGNSYTFIAEGIIPEGSDVQWDFGGTAIPGTANGDTVSGIVFQNEGFHNVTLTVTNGPCQSVYSNTIEVLSAPDPFFDSPQDTCIDVNNYTFVAKGTYGPGTTFQWDFGAPGDVNTPTSTAPTASNIQFLRTGWHYITLTATDQGCVFSHTDSVYIAPSPTAGFDDRSAPQCLNLNSYNFFPNVTIDSTATVSWDFGPNANPSTSDSDTVAVVFTAPGTYYVTLSVYNKGCTAVHQGEINVVDAPFGFVSDEPAQCIDINSFDFAGSGIFGPSASFLWVFPNGTPGTATTRNVNDVVFNSPGIYEVQFTVTENSCSDTFRLDVEVTPVPVPSFENIPDQCISNGPFDFNFDGSAGSAAVFTWDFDDGIITSDSTVNSRSVPGVDFPSPGNKVITLTIEENGCTETYTQTINLSPAPIASYDPQAPQCVTVNTFDFNNTGTFGAGATISWDFGPNASPSNSTDMNPTGVTFNSPGNYPVSLSVTEFGCVDIYTDTVRVTPVPAPAFDPGTPQCVDVNSFSFNSLGSNGPTATFSWDFGPNANPSTSTAENPNGINFNSPGLYIVTLTVTEYGCSGSFSDTVEVTPAPAPDFATPSNGCESNNNYSFSGGGSFGSNATFSWDFGPNASPSTSNIKDPSGISFTGTGYHTIAYSISENGCTYTHLDSVLITPEPAVVIEPEAPQCLDVNSFDFSAINSSYGPDATFQWDFGANASIATSNSLVPPTVSFNVDGNHPVYFTIFENGCTVTDSIIAVVTPKPVPTFTYTGGRQQCIDAHALLFNITGSYGNDASLSWDFGPDANQPSSTSPTPAGIVYSTVGVHYITLTISEYGCTETYTDSVEITPSPVPNAPGVAPQCINVNSFDFTGSGTFGPNATFQWNFTNVATPSFSNQQNPSGVVFNAPGTYNVTFSVSENGCTENQTIVVEVTDAPDATFTASDPTQCVNGNSFDFNITNGANLTTNATYSWDFGPNSSPATSTQKSPTGVTYSDSGIYTVTVSVSENGCVDVYSLQLTVYPEPIPDFVSDTADCAPFAVQFTDNSYAWVPLTYAWDFGDGTTGVGPNPQHTYTDPGTYDVTLTVTDNTGCPGDYSIVKTGQITVYEDPIAGFDMESSEVSVFDGVIEFYNTANLSDIANLYFDFGDGSPTVNTSDTSYQYMDPGYYYPMQVLVSNNGCVDTLIREVYIRPEYKLFAPNAFSPDGNGQNDVYIQKGIGIGTYEMIIYNRWGEEVFSTTDINEGWDGVDQRTGMPAKQDIYIYLTKVQDVFGKAYKYKGSITLVR